VPNTDRPSNPEQQLVVAVGLQTAVLDAILRELRAARESRIHALWHTAIVAVAAIGMFVALRHVMPERPITVTTNYVPPIGLVSR
jgi:hypothetical protein